jgi:hypothetical protein
MMRSGGDDAARQKVLTSLLGRKVVAATWPGAAEAVRTLTNSSAEQAMPLFTGMDALQASAARFGWVNPDGSLSFRELPAREALRSALQNQVHFVVIDIGTEHATEFARAEIERVLGPKAEPVAEAPKSSRPTRAGQATAAGAVSKRARPLHDIDTPFGVERTTAQTAMPPIDRRAAVARKRRVEETVPFDTAVMPATAPLQRSTDAGIAPPHTSTEPPPPMRERPADQASISLPPLLESLPPRPAASAAPASPSPPPVPAKAARKLPSKTQTEFPATMPPPRASAGDASQQKAIESAMHEAMSAPTVFEAGADDQDENASRAEPIRFAAPKLPLPDTVLSQLSEVLRKYPEVEWACEVSDGSATPAIGLRISPSFITRAEEIRAGLARVAGTCGAPLSVVVLTERDRMREARADGHAFYPWRRRGKKA